MRTFRTAATALACTVAAAILAGCGSTLAGTAQPGEIDIRRLDVGNYPTEPPNAHDDDYQPLFIDMGKVAAMRLADHVASAYDIDPRMKYSWTPSSISKGTLPGELGRPEVLEPIAERHRMMFGFHTNGSDQDVSLLASGWPTKPRPNSTTVGTIVMQFPDPDRARQAAAEFFDADFGGYRDQNEPVPLPRQPQARAHWRPGSPFLRAILAHGSYVVAFLVSANAPDRDALVALAEKAFDVQLPLLDQLPPLTEEEMLRLPWDPDHLLSRTLNPAKVQSPSYDDSNALLGLRGIMQYAEDREYAKQRFTAMGAEKFAVSGGTLVIRTANAEKARRVVAERITPTVVAGPAEPPQHVPDSACVENRSGLFDDRRFTCVVAYKEYVGFVAANQLLDAQQRAAAQYSIFANSR
ncbi:MULTISPECIES: DUF7373 family lipoprotein [Nocardia]|uniref:Uncharacterized protein n=1 Tax=Nocardia sputorum TaxID=2984338 RepID=A0ABN6UC64_9NOCA|nr:hypothetical protein [Nocardia sputorum]BDT94337.1 hypothetical protein IFM12275_43130 [Nocardia sputorum]BDU02420.1 hypothetical protein IFM12276_54480 [Nocardia sputorum]